MIFFQFYKIESYYIGDRHLEFYEKNIKPQNINDFGKKFWLSELIKIHYHKMYLKLLLFFPFILFAKCLRQSFLKLLCVNSMKLIELRSNLATFSVLLNFFLNEQEERFRLSSQFCIKLIFYEILIQYFHCRFIVNRSARSEQKVVDFSCLKFLFYENLYN